MRSSFLLLGLLGLAGTALAQAPAKEPVTGTAKVTTGSVTLDGLTAAVPRAWVFEQPNSDMRKAQWRVPPAAGDEGSVEAVLFYFGKGRGGDLDRNLTRWASQFVGEDKRPIPMAEVATKKEKKGNLTVTRVEMGGRYVAPKDIGSGEFFDQPNWHMSVVVVETPNGPFFFRVVGPRATVAAQKEGLDAMVKSLKFKG